MVFDAPTLEFSYKNDDLGDPLLNDDHALALGLASREELALIRKYSLNVNRLLRKIWGACGITLVDFKEIGVQLLHPHPQPPLLQQPA